VCVCVCVCDLSYLEQKQHNNHTPTIISSGQPLGGHFIV